MPKKSTTTKAVKKSSTPKSSTTGKVKSGTNGNKTQDVQTTSPQGDQAMNARVVSAKTVTDDHIRNRAYEIYLSRNGEDGDPMADWLRAEHELTQVSQVRK